MQVKEARELRDLATAAGSEFPPYMLLLTRFVNDRMDFNATAGTAQQILNQAEWQQIVTHLCGAQVYAALSL